MFHLKNISFLTIFLAELTRGKLGWWTLELGMILGVCLVTMVLVMRIGVTEEGLLTKHSGGILRAGAVRSGGAEIYFRVNIISLQRKKSSLKVKTHSL